MPVPYRASQSSGSDCTVIVTVRVRRIASVIVWRKRRSSIPWWGVKGVGVLSRAIYWHTLYAYGSGSVHR
jgi:hypothetical protein